METTEKQGIKAAIGLMGAVLAVIIMPKIVGKSGFWYGVGYWIVGGILFSVLAYFIIGPDETAKETTV